MKLKYLKLALKNWAKDENNNVSSRIKFFRNQLSSLSAKLLQDHFSENLHKEESRIKAELGIRQSQELGDKNTQFFHSSIKVRQARNYIRQLYTDTGQRVSILIQNSIGSYLINLITGGFFLSLW